MGVRNGKHRSSGKAVARTARTLFDDLESPEPQLTVASFFSGIGGFDLGFERNGFSISYQCEIHDYCTTILKRRWPEITRGKNIKEVLDAGTIPDASVWVGGFPCQDVSVARMGPRAGLKGQQSGLFHEFSRLVEHHSPRVVLIENVPGLLSSHKGRDFQIVIRTLAELGYCVGWRVLNSKNFGVAQSRQRVFIVGTHRERRGPGEILFEPERSQGHVAAGGSNGKGAISPFKESVGDLVKGPVVKKLAHCLYACSARHTGTDWSRNYAVYPDGRVRRFLPVECERLQGFPAGWTIPPEDSKFRNIDDLDSLRYHALGNAVTVPVAEWLASRIKSFLLNTSRVEQLAEAP
jgi:DNA (cytosine-5)-methyltransferase 1